MADNDSPQAGSRSAWDMAWMAIFGAGAALVIVARMIYLFTHLDSVADKDKTTAIFSFLGLAALPAGLALLSFFQKSLGWGARAALAIAAAYFLVVGTAFKLG